MSVLVDPHGLDREQVIAMLRAHEQNLRERGVAHAALFGSLARGEANPHDIDILIELRPDAPISLFDYLGLTHFLTDLFPVRVDVANRGALKPHVRQGAERDAVYAF